MSSENNKKCYDAMVEGAESAGISVRSSTSENADEKNRPLYELLCAKLADVIPEDIFAGIKQMPQMSFANLIMLALGGRIVLKYPNLDLTKEFDVPEEVEYLNDDIEGYSFRIARTPFDALATAFSVRKNYDFEVKMACECEGILPLIIMKDKEHVSMGLVHCEDRTLSIPLGAVSNASVDIFEAHGEGSEALEKGAEEAADLIAKSMDEALQEIKANGWASSPEEKEAIQQWAKKHSYKVIPAFRMSLDVVL